MPQSWWIPHHGFLKCHNPLEVWWYVCRSPVLLVWVCHMPEQMWNKSGKCWFKTFSSLWGLSRIRMLLWLRLNETGDAWFSTEVIKRAPAIVYSVCYRVSSFCSSHNISSIIVHRVSYPTTFIVYCLSCPCYRLLLIINDIMYQLKPKINNYTEMIFYY